MKKKRRRHSSRSRNSSEIPKLNRMNNRVAKVKKREKKSLLMYFAFFMIVSGVLILLYPIVGNYLANRERSEAVRTYDHTMENLTQEKTNQLLKQAKKFNQYLYKKQQGELVDEMVYQSIVSEGEVMGTVDIPGIDIEALPFYNGTSYKTLDKGLGHLESSSIPIGGKNTRSVITGHSGVKNQVLFTDIKNLKEGDIFFVNILGKRLSYEIESFEEVLPSEVDKVRIIPDKDIMTLLTCTPPGINTYRLLVTGHRIPYEKAMTKKVDKRNLWSYQNIVLTTLGICAVIFVLLWIIYKRLLKKSEATVPEISKKAKRNIRRLIFITRGLFILLLITMIGVLIIAIYGYFQMQRETDLGSIDVGATEELYAFNTDKILKGNYEEKDIASVNVENFAEAKGKIQQTVNEWGIGKLAIPKVNIDLPILAGLYNANLLNGVATYHQDQKLGEGNYPLLAHNIYEQNVLLHRIKELKQGDKVYASDFRKIYEYRVVRNEVIKDTEIEVLKKKSTRPMITLLRCEGDIGTPNRRIVQGQLTSIEEIGQTDESLLKKLKFKKKEKIKDGLVIKENPISYYDQFCMNISANILGNPLQTVVPLFLLLVLPIIFLSLIRN